MPTKVLITGATGFVGANLARHMTARTDCKVHLLVRKHSDLWRIHDMKDRFSQIHFADLQESREAAAEVIKAVQPDIVYHTAAYGGFPNQTDKDTMVRVNLLATMYLLDAAVEEKVPCFIHTGSSSEYGIKDAPMREEDVCKPVNFYGITKLAATNYCAMAGMASTVTRVCTLRLFSPYGDWEDSSRLYPSIVKALEEGESPRLSRPHSVRDFIPIGQVVKLYEKIVALPFKPGDIINIGSGKQQTIEQFYYGIAQSMGKGHIEPVWGEAPPRAHEPRMWQADVTKLRALLGRLQEGDEA